jgi:predicted nucleotidyltransferase component of viral defense system
MIVDELKNIVANVRPQNRTSVYTRSLLKEYLQTYILNFIYLNPTYDRNFIFTGGTCLRRCFGLNRLSEDLDFDLETPVDSKILKKGLDDYFRLTYLYRDLDISLLQQGKQILLKFPVLKELNLASGSESDLLYVKIDLSPVTSKIYQKYTTLNNTNNFNYIVTHYDLPSLMANKIVAILSRNRFQGKDNLEIIKGRDYFDLLWFLEKKVKPNVPRINDLLKKKLSQLEIVSLLDDKVKKAVTTYKQELQRDLIPFIDNPELLEGYTEGYKYNYDFQKQYLRPS